MARKQTEKASDDNHHTQHHRHIIVKNFYKKHTNKKIQATNVACIFTKGKRPNVSKGIKPC